MNIISFLKGILFNTQGIAIILMVGCMLISKWIPLNPKMAIIISIIFGLVASLVMGYIAWDISRYPDCLVKYVFKHRQDKFLRRAYLMYYTPSTAARMLMDAYGPAGVAEIKATLRWSGPMSYRIRKALVRKYGLDTK